MINKISFFGTSHLGLVYSSVMANYAKKIVCYDSDKKNIDCLKKLKFSVKEPKLRETIKKNKKNFFFTNNYHEAENSDLVFVSKDVNTNDKNESDLAEIKNIFFKINKVIKNKETPIIFLSQLPPGFCTNLQKKTKREIYYQVETLVFGNAINRALYPERIIVGSKNKKITNKKYLSLLKNFSCPILNMTYETAEITKIAINIFLISTAMTSNFMSLISEKILFNWDNVIEALKLDKRIGKYAYLKPSLGLAGGNLERDLVSIEKLCKKNNIETSLIEGWKKISNIRKLWVYKILKKILTKNKKIKKISILGIAYKENTNSIKNSNSIYIIKKFKNHKFLFYDKHIKNIDTKNANSQILDKNILKSQVILIMNMTDLFRNFLKKNSYFIKNKLIIDPYNITKKLKLRKNNTIYNLGKIYEK